jgi:Predicted exonuclease of the beta-lactamase fold involved in RNA processing
MIYLDNGISVFSGRQYRCDPKSCARDSVNLVSHAHFDHVPSTIRGDIVCSEITGAVAGDRTGIPLPVTDCPDVTMLDSGHVPGSTMFLIGGERKILYTGDLCTRPKYFSRGAQPVSADVLIIESTFGRDKYVFPPTAEVVGSMRDWAEDNAAKGLHSVIYAYTFGKAQEVLAEMNGFDLYTSAPVTKINAILAKFGHSFSARPLSDEPGEPSVIVTSSAGRNDPQVKKFLASGARTASVSGWAIDSGHRYAMRVDAAFPLSDHADYAELMEFTRRVSPEIVYTVHGSGKELARDIREKLDIEAVPLRKGHLTLSHFT